MGRGGNPGGGLASTCSPCGSISLPGLASRRPSCPLFLATLAAHSLACGQDPGQTGRFRGRSALGAGCLPAFVHTGDPQSSFPRRHTCAALSDSWLLLPTHPRHQEPLFSTALLYSCRSWSNLLELGSSLGAQTSGSPLNFSLPHFSHPMKGDTSRASLLGFLWELGEILCDVPGGIANAQQAREARASLCVRLAYQTVNRFEAENTPFPPRPKRSASHQPCTWQLSAKGGCEFNFHPGVCISAANGEGREVLGLLQRFFPRGNQRDNSHLFNESFPSWMPNSLNVSRLPGDSVVANKTVKVLLLAHLMVC